ncbi:MAG: hypothetical protein IJS22_09500 [Lachnospiraceae bacterium]|nr:hypothetical protein [Lachnospiraceae bacterium]
MKKIFVLMIAFAALALTACGGSDEPKTEAGSASADAYVFEYKGTKIAMNAQAAAIVEALGEPKNYVETPSCAFNGLDKEYNYGSFILYTYPMDDVDYVLQVVLMDDLVSTAEGVSIGSSRDQVTAAYGDGAKTVGTGLEYDKGDCQLTFVMDGDTVKSIQYYAVTGLK